MSKPLTGPILAGQAYTAEALNSLIDEHRRLSAIVRGLAGRDPLTDIDPDYGNWICLLCPDDFDEEGPLRLSAADVPHHEDCPWRQARDWAAR